MTLISDQLFLMYWVVFQAESSCQFQQIPKTYQQSVAIQFINILLSVGSHKPKYLNFESIECRTILQYTDRFEKRKFVFLSNFYFYLNT